MTFRHPPSVEHDDLGVRTHEVYTKRIHETLSKDLKPTNYEVRKRNMAWQVYVDYEEFGLPFNGGSYEQPRWWKRALDCVLRARNEARWELKRIEAQEQASESDDY